MAPPLRVVLDESVPADLTTLDALARLHLEARRQGFELRLLGVPEALRKLIDFAGLRDVLCVEP
jgi:ABC-type transporter Mla MlaB component